MDTHLQSGRDKENVPANTKLIAEPSTVAHKATEGAKHTRVDDRKAERQSRFLKALGIKGQITGACQVSGVSRPSVYEWMAADSEFKARVDEAFRVHADWLESRLFDVLEAMDPSKPPNPTYLALALNGARPEKYKGAIIDTSDTAKQVMSEFRKSKGKGAKGKAQKSQEQVTQAAAQELVEKLRNRRSRA